MNAPLIDAKLDAAFEQLAEDLQGLEVGNELFSRRSYWEQYRHIHHLTTSITKNATLLDWGAGVGHFGYIQELLGAKVSAYTVEIDDATPYDPILMGLIGKTNITHRSHGHPVELPFDNGSFDVVVSCGVLEHVREFDGSDSGSMEEIARVLKPGGHFLCFHLPSSHSLSEYVRRKLKRPHHAFTYTAKEFEGLSAASGLRVDTRIRYGVLPWNTLAQYVSGPTGRRLGRLDGLLGQAFGPMAQNFGFICTKPASGPTEDDEAPGPVY